MEYPPLSVVIPAYNEALRLPKTLIQLIPYLKKKFTDWEVVVSNDGSVDQTVQMVKNFSQEEPRIRGVSLKRHRGKGAALALGVSAAEKDWILLYDADGAVPIQQIERFLLILRQDSQILIGSRDLGNSARRMDQPWLRRRLGRAFVLFRKWMIGLKEVEDTQCGFKLLRTEVAKRLFSGLTTPGFLFDVEILGKAKILGLPIQELGVECTHVAESKVSVSRELPRIISELNRIRGVLKEFRGENPP